MVNFIVDGKKCGGYSISRRSAGTAEPSVFEGFVSYLYSQAALEASPLQPICFLGHELSLLASDAQFEPVHSAGRSTKQARWASAEVKRTSGATPSARDQARTP